LKKLLSKNKKSYWTTQKRAEKLFSFIAAALLFCCAAFAQGLKDKTVITGDVMEVLRSGETTVSKGNSKAVNGRNTIKSDKMVYNKKSSFVSASGNVRLYSKTDDGEPLEAKGDFADYNLSLQRGKLWGKKTNLKYFPKGGDKMEVNSKELLIDRNLETLSAYKDVEIVTSSGTIYSDNAVFDKKTSSLKAVKEKKRPLADVIYDGRKGRYVADEMIFYNSKDDKKIAMTGNVKGKIEMNDN
jgi:lipopolysaccharide export system protein LptA